tara:strand:- start:202 stop:774 length:573 start_codon:yes stop_codon:yes gene_type:complete
MKNKTILFNSFNSLSLDSNLIDALMILIGSLSIGILAQISIPIPFSPVPITGQTIGVVLVGSLLGSRRGTLCIVLYLMEGSLGLPVFANMKAGAHVLFGPTGGYLWGFIIAAFLMGYFKEKQFIYNPFNCFVACFVATSIILLVGAFYLSFIIGDMKKGLAMGLYPFLFGDIIKSFICASIIQGSKKIFS